jgi:serine/threonine-protein kinase PpkA
MLQQIGKYRIEGTLGHGAMGVVYRGMDDSLQRPVAIKTIHAHLLGDEFGEQLLMRFKTEALAAARCQHNNIVTVYDFGQHDGMPYIAMEFVKGRGLDDIIKEAGGALPLKRINAILMGICRGLHFAHQQGIVHRDIKPANVMVLEGDAVKIADFGIARIPTSDLTQIGSQLGTPSYMPPEQREGVEVDQRADIFALGVIIFEMLAKCPDIPEALRVQTVQALKELPPSKKLDRNQHFPRSIAAFLEKCLSPEAATRFANMAQVVEGYKQAQLNMRGNTAAPAGGDPDATQIGGAPARPARVLPPTKTEPEPDEVAPVRRAFPVLDAIRALKALDPVLNDDWHDRLCAMLEPLDEQGRQRVYTNVIKPKNISWDEKAAKYVFEGRPTLRDLTVGLSTPQLAQLADKLMKTLEDLRSSRDIMVIADALEGGLNTIDRFNPDENQSRQKEKLKLRDAYLYDFALAVRQMDFDPPKNQRGLTVDAIKTFIIEVFIKHQLMGYWFATVPLYDLRQDENAFVASTVVKEARVRRFDVVRTARYYFLVGPVLKYEMNQYSVRRFLSEDTAMGGKLVYFNSLAVDRTAVHDPAVQQKVSHDITRIITIQRQLSARIIELVDSFDTNQHKYLLPLLFKPLEADGTSLDAAIAQRLLDYERNLARLVLGKIPVALRDLAKNQDDYEYLFFGLRTFLLEVLGNVQDFAAQSSAQWSTESQELEHRIASYLRLLEKRKPFTFTLERDQAMALDPNLDTSLPVKELKKIVDDCEPALADLTEKLKEAINDAQEEMSRTQAMFARVFKGKQKVEPDEVRAEIAKTRRDSFLAIVRVPKRYLKVSVYLEFEDLVPVDDKVRHYAFPNGDLGFSLLPILVTLPENKDEFDIRTVRKVVEFDLFKAASKWNAEATGALI